MLLLLFEGRIHLPVFGFNIISCVSTDMTVLIFFLLTVVRALPPRNGTHLSDHTSNVINPSDYLLLSSKTTHFHHTKSSIPTFSEKASNFQALPLVMTTPVSQKRFSTPIYGTDQIRKSHNATIPFEDRKTIPMTLNTIEPSSPVSRYLTDQLEMASHNDGPLAKSILRTPSLNVNTKHTYLNSEFHATSIPLTAGAYLHNNIMLDRLNSTSMFTTIFVSSSLQSDLEDGYILVTVLANETKDVTDFSTNFSATGKQKVNLHMIRCCQSFGCHINKIR